MVNSFDNQIADVRALFIDQPDIKVCYEGKDIRFPACEIGLARWTRGIGWVASPDEARNGQKWRFAIYIHGTDEEECRPGAARALEKITNGHESYIKCGPDAETLLVVDPNTNKHVVRGYVTFYVSLNEGEAQMITPDIERVHFGYRHEPTFQSFPGG